MRLPALLTIVGVSIALLAAPVLPSDIPFAWHREIFLGGNGKEHIYLVSALSNSGSEDEDVESLFVCRRSNSAPRTVQRKLLRATIRSGTPGEDRETFVAALDLPRYLADRNCHPGFFDTTPESIAVDEGGMYYHEEGLRSYFLGRADLESWANLDLPDLDARGEDRRVVGVYQTTMRPDPVEAAIDYLLVRSGGGMDDGGQFEGIVPVLDSKMRDAMNDVRNRIAARHEGRATKR